MREPLISVVLANHNGGRYLPLAVESVLAQTCREFEFIIVDDGSDDGSWDYLQSIDDPRLRLFHNVVNRGQTASLNIGLDAVCGRYLARMDSDDICLPTRFETQVQFLEQNPDVDILGSQARLIDTEGREHGMTRLPNGPTSVWAYGFLQNPFVHPSVMMRSTLVRRHGVRFDERFFNQDFELWSRLLPNHIACNVEDTLIRYRVHPESMTLRHQEVNIQSAVKIIRVRLQVENLDDLMSDPEIDALLRYVFADRRVADMAGVDRANLGRVLCRIVTNLKQLRPNTDEFVDLIIYRLVQSCLWPHGARNLAGHAALARDSVAKMPMGWVRLLTRVLPRELSGRLRS